VYDRSNPLVLKYTIGGTRIPRQSYVSERGEKSRTQVRRDIQGLRAFAVLAVIADHLTGYPAGGFVGVDIFFVISGFIITSALLREHDRTGRISFADFYRRRARRILPVSTLVLVATVGASYLVFRPGAALSVFTDGVAALLFSANWRLAITGTDYWAADGALSPLQHYWSLAVEEQFYFVWPVLIVLSLVIAPKLFRLRKPLSVLGIVLAALISISFAWALFDTSNSPTWAYFSTFSRAWELGFGALLAVCAPVLGRLPDRTRPYISWLGIIGALASLSLIDGDSGIPAPGAILPVVAAGLVIAAGTGGNPKFLWPLTNPLSQYAGNLSFSLYLWHFPVIVLLQPFFSDGGRLYGGLVLLITAVLSMISYHFLENPIRRSRWLEPKTARQSIRPLLVTVGAAAAVASLVIVTVAIQPAAQADASADESTGQWADPTSLTLAIDASLDADEWPELTPSIDSVKSEGAPLEDRLGCSHVTVADLESCNFPSAGATKSAVVLGDSTGITLLPTVRGALGDDYNVRGLTMAACVNLDVEINFTSKETQKECAEHKVNSVDEILRTEPDLVFITTMYGYIDDMASGTPGRLGGPEWEAGTTSLIQKLAPSGALIVIVGSPPLGKSISTCATKMSTPSDCKGSISTSFRVVTEANERAADSTGAKFINTRSWFCNDWDECPLFIGTTPVKRDAVHTTRQFADMVVPLFRNELHRLTAGQ
jgi:peptidoglycan/LPS O-acetylase OafA/YrhL